ncbi:MAG TPA: phosphoglucomutase/phosphomannomutase family protein [Abditibacteriaceae bacterium]|nr:phosphoglucomutase/phosphomannomutase family protein [Abditibacteriaceae bacterium]
MKTTPIKFGTDGWRAIIADEYTFANVRAVSTALAAYLQKHEKQKAGAGVAIGYDTRFLSTEFARLTAETIAAAGIPVRLANRDCPTPAISWAVRNGNLAAGVMLTASHNPPKWNGFKVITPRGGPADKEATNAIESLIGKKIGLAKTATIEEFDPRPDFESQLRKVIDFRLLKKARGNVVCDFVHGVGRNYLDDLLRECGWRVTTLRGEPDPMFGGILPDPANPKCHNSLQEMVLSKKASLGLANDPDADRFGIVDSAGEYLTPNQVLALVYVHLLEYRGMSGDIARTVATTHLLDAIAAHHGQEAIETPVGFKWLGTAIEEQGAILGGEESGGLSIAGHLPGKDGVLADLLVAEIWALHRQPLGQLYRQLLKKYGAYYSTRTDLHLDAPSKDALMHKMQNATPETVGGAKVKNVITLDGVKLNLDDGSWLLMRPSGTEPIVRVYLEARSKSRLKELQKAAQSLR